MTEVKDLEAQNVDSISQAMSLIDQGLGEISERQLVSTSEMADLLLDVRGVLSRLDPEVSTN